jgi:hypothetical protein
MFGIVEMTLAAMFDIIEMTLSVFHQNLNHVHAWLKETSPIIVVYSCMLQPHCIRCSHFKVEDVSALEPSSKPPVRIVEENVTASLHQQHTPCPWLRPGCRDDVTWIC